MDRDRLLERYESLGDERDYDAARPLYEAALAEGADARLLNDYGYLLACHARRELRRAVELYERAIELDPSDDKPHWQLISARESLGESDLAVATYAAHVAAAPEDVRAYRFLAQAHLGAGGFAAASEVVDRGLALAPDDVALIALRGEARARLGDPDGALADWQHALELEPEDIGPLYSTAFLLERLGRTDEAVEAWERIVRWNEARGCELQSVWPKEELTRLRSG